MEKSPQELLLDENIMLEIPEGVDEAVVEEIIEHAIDIDPEKLVADLNKVWQTEVGVDLADRSAYQIRVFANRVKESAERLKKNPSSEANKSAFRQTVNGLYDQLESAQQQYLESKEQQKRTQQIAAGNQDKAVQGVRDNILTTGVSKFDRTVRELGGWQQNQGVQGLAETLTRHMNTQKITQQNQLHYLDFPFLEKFIKKYGRNAGLGENKNNLYILRKWITQGIDRSYQGYKQEWDAFKQGKAAPKAPQLKKSAPAPAALKAPPPTAAQPAVDPPMEAPPQPPEAPPQEPEAPEPAAPEPAAPEPVVPEDFTYSDDFNFGEDEKDAREGYVRWKNELEPNLQRFEAEVSTNAKKVLLKTVAGMFLIPFYFELPISAEEFYKTHMNRFGAYKPKWFAISIGRTLKKHLRHFYTQERFEPEHFINFFRKSARDSTGLWNDLFRIAVPKPGRVQRFIPWENMNQDQHEAIRHRYTQSLRIISEGMQQALMSFGEVGILQTVFPVAAYRSKRNAVISRRQITEILKQFDREGPFQEQFDTTHKVKTRAGGTIDIGYDTAALYLERELRKGGAGWQNVRNRTHLWIPQQGFIARDEFQKIQRKKTTYQEFQDIDARRSSKSPRKTRSQRKFASAKQLDVMEDPQLGDGVNGERTENQEIYSFLMKRIKEHRVARTSTFDVRQMVSDFYRRNPHRIGERTSLQRLSKFVRIVREKFKQGPSPMLGRGRAGAVYPILNIPPRRTTPYATSSSSDELIELPPVPQADDLPEGVVTEWRSEDDLEFGEDDEDFGEDDEDFGEDEGQSGSVKSEPIKVETVPMARPALATGVKRAADEHPQVKMEDLEALKQQYEFSSPQEQATLLRRVEELAESQRDDENLEQQDRDDEKSNVPVPIRRRLNIPAVPAVPAPPPPGALAPPPPGARAVDVSASVWDEAPEALPTPATVLRDVRVPTEQERLGEILELERQREIEDEQIELERQREITGGYTFEEIAEHQHLEDEIVRRPRSKPVVVPSPDPPTPAWYKEQWSQETAPTDMSPKLTRKRFNTIIDELKRSLLLQVLPRQYKSATDVHVDAYAQEKQNQIEERQRQRLLQHNLQRLRRGGYAQEKKIRKGRRKQALGFWKKRKVDPAVLHSRFPEMFSAPVGGGEEKAMPPTDEDGSLLHSRFPEMFSAPVGGEEEKAMPPTGPGWGAGDEPPPAGGDDFDFDTYFDEAEKASIETPETRRNSVYGYFRQDRPDGSKFSHDLMEILSARVGATDKYNRWKNSAGGVAQFTDKLNNILNKAGEFADLGLIRTIRDEIGKATLENKKTVFRLVQTLVSFVSPPPTAPIPIPIPPAAPIGPGYDFSAEASVPVVHPETPAVAEEKPQRPYQKRSEGLPPTRSPKDGKWETDETGSPVALVFPDGARFILPKSPEDLDRMLESGSIRKGEDLYNLFRSILLKKSAKYGGSSVGSSVAEGLRRQRLSFGEAGGEAGGEDDASYVGGPRRRRIVPDDEKDAPAPPPARGRPRVPGRVRRPNILYRGRPRRRPAPLGGLAGVAQGVERGVPRANLGRPIDPQNLRLLMHQRYQPRDQDPASQRLLTFTSSERPGEELQTFERNARRDNPFYAMGCHTGAKQHEIGDFILLCIEQTKVNIVIYRQVTRGAIKILVKKLRHHLKGTQFARARLMFFGGRELFSRVELLKKGEVEITRQLFSIAKSNSSTRLILENSSGGPMSEEWFHTWRANRHI